MRKATEKSRRQKELMEKKVNLKIKELILPAKTKEILKPKKQVALLEYIFEESKKNKQVGKPHWSYRKMGSFISGKTGVKAKDERTSVRRLCDKINAKVFKDDELCFKYYLYEYGIGWSATYDPKEIYKEKIKYFSTKIVKEQKRSKPDNIKIHDFNNKIDEIKEKYKEIFGELPILIKDKKKYITNIKIKDDEIKKAIILKFLDAIVDDMKNQLKYYTLFNLKDKNISGSDYIPVDVKVYKKFNQNMMGYSRIREDKSDSILWEEAKKTLLRNERRIMVISDSGMGKSTLLRYEAMLLAIEKKMKINEISVGDIILPLYLEFTDLDNQDCDIFNSIEKLLRSKYRKVTEQRYNIFKEKIIQGKMILIIDGLDRIPLGKLYKLAKKFNDFIRQYRCRVICSSRKTVYYVFDFIMDSRIVEIDYFTSEKIIRFVDTIFKDHHSSMNENINSKQDFLNELLDKSKMFNLSRNPLHLTLICHLYHNKEISVPITRSDVYRRISKYMLKVWNQKENTERKYSYIPKLNILGELANYLCDKGEYDIEEDILYNWLDDYLKFNKNIKPPEGYHHINTSTLINELCNSGIITYSGVENTKYTFLHQTFQEFFAAMHLKRVLEKDQHVCIEIIKSHLWDYNFHEVIIMLAELMDYQKPLIQLFDDNKDYIVQGLPEFPNAFLSLISYGNKGRSI